MSGDTLAQRFKRTIYRLEQKMRAVYPVKFIWECEFEESGLVKQKLLTHPIVEQSRLYSSDALYGSRNEAMRLHCQAREN